MAPKRAYLTAAKDAFSASEIAGLQGDGGPFLLSSSGHAPETKELTSVEHLRHMTTVKKLADELNEHNREHGDAQVVIVGDSEDSRSILDFDLMFLQELGRKGVLEIRPGPNR